MKRNLFIALCACVMAFSLAACGSSSASNAAGSVASASGESQAAEKTVELGTSEGSTYENDYFKISFALPEGWTFADADQLAQLNSSIGDVTDNEAVAKALENGSAAIDMMAQSADNLSNVNVTIEGTNAITAAVTSDEQILDNALQTAQEQLASQGATDIQVAKETTEFCGQTCQSARISMNISSVTIYENMVLLKQGNYLLLATATSTFNDATNELIAQFQAL